ncbi:MAG: NADH-quinone oxidoreductase subunit J [Armatimonadetes bacterium]|nr:NADH-quinone oxidoreductase subunit J [Armatimonadota bacterium]
MSLYVCFLGLVVLTIMPAFMVVTARNIVHAAVYLGASFVGVAGLYLLLSAPFLAAAQVLIYVGAITVLILFAIMLTAQRLMREPRHALPARILSGVLSFGLFVLLVWTAQRGPWKQVPEDQRTPSGEYLNQLSGSLLGTYLLPFEIASVLLLAALVGAIILAKEERED